VKRLFAVALGVLTAIGGFVDIGDLVTNAVVGSRFGMSLAWVVVVGVVGICLFANMSGRVAAVSGRATFEIIRERLGPRAGLANLGASFFINLMTMAAEIGGIALAMQLVTGVEPLLWMPLAAFAVWIVVWRAKFSQLENAAGLLGLSPSSSPSPWSCWARTGAPSRSRPRCRRCRRARTRRATGTTRSPCSARR
jgi:Mn2+/Fe2+ NRAMP family transporter